MAVREIRRSTKSACQEEHAQLSSWPGSLAFLCADGFLMDQSIEILWQSDSVVAVNKPDELPSQAPEGIESLQSVLRKQLDRQQGYLEMPHRLDRGVSGVLLVATTKRAARLLSEQFSSRKIIKHYLALVHGTPGGGATPWCWTNYLRKIPDRAFVETCEATATGAKKAETWVESITPNPTTQDSLLSLRPVTGRMHQLRVQTAVRGHPIIGDPLYGNPENATSDPKDCGDVSRMQLHAHQIQFFDPKSGRKIVVKTQNPLGQ